MTFLQFTFQSFWHFLGMIMLIGVLCNTIVSLIRGNKS